ncbi:uncharacterized protein RMCC_3864 [Mycolicibacterium canariasense]|uniref:Uncharacterized protein n=1 Tax=Mycolicibacterium canariasense TaxID=228230 RepID=A0A100WF68_MYCCR|nr:uncharacterized protein RMCC_3864 [Mycolicibacterium canariasense]
MATLRAGSQSNELEMMMSIPALPRHHGVHVPRFVTVAGRVVFDNVTTTPSGPVHRDYGPVTAVAPHRFHGGEEEADNVLAQSHVDWWADHGALTRHVDAMKESFPEFLYLPSDDGAPPSWGGVIDTGRGRFTVLIMTRRDQRSTAGSRDAATARGERGTPLAEAAAPIHYWKPMCRRP